MVTYHHQETIRLSTSSSVAPRSYIRWALCFPHDETKAAKETTVSHIQKAVDDLVRRWPHLRGFLVLSEDESEKGRLRLSIPDKSSEEYVITHHDGSQRSDRFFRHPPTNDCTYGADKGILAPVQVKSTQVENLDAVEHWLTLFGSHPITLEEVHHAQLDFNSYDTLAEHGFPERWLPNVELGPLPNRPGSNPAPVFGGKVTFVNGGLIIALYYHHGISDGVCTDKLVNALATATRGAQILHPPPVIHRQEELESSPGEVKQSEDPHEIVRGCKEYCFKADSIDQGPGEHLRTVNPRPEGGFLPYKAAVGYTFCFGAETISKLRKEINTKFRLANLAHSSEISTNDVLAAIVWVHATSARSRNPEHRPRQSTSQIYVPVDHRKRVVPNVKDNYVGYGVSTATASMDISCLVETARCNTETAYITAITNVATEIHRAVKEIDDAFVRRRFQLARSLTDVRELTLNRNPDDNIDLAFNTWARLGVDYGWSIPGVPAVAAAAGVEDLTPGVRAPDAVRRTWSGYVNGSCLVQPRKGSSNHNNSNTPPTATTPQGATSTSTTPPTPPHASSRLDSEADNLSLYDVRSVGDLKRYARRGYGAPPATRDAASSPESPGSPHEVSSDDAALAGAEAPWEVMVQLWPEDMGRLRGDGRFLGLVDRIVG